MCAGLACVPTPPRRNRKPSWPRVANTTVNEWREGGGGGGEGRDGNECVEIVVPATARGYFWSSVADEISNRHSSEVIMHSDTIFVQCSATTYMQFLLCSDTIFGNELGY